MSTFGDGTFKQNIYEEIQYRMQDHGLDFPEAVQQVLDVCGWMLCSNTYKEDIYAQALEQAKAEILAKIS